MTTVTELFKKQDERFEERFKTPLEWIILNCKDEIIAGVDMNQLNKELQSHISKIREETLQAVLGAKAGDTVNVLDAKAGNEKVWRCIEIKSLDT